MAAPEHVPVDRNQPVRGYASPPRRPESWRPDRPGEVLAGAVAVALKRASLFGRAPVVHNLTVALTIWGFLGEAPAPLVELRRPLFEEVWHPHHYAELRRIVDLVPEASLRLTPAQVTDAHRADHRGLLGDLGQPAA